MPAWHKVALRTVTATLWEELTGVALCQEPLSPARAVVSPDLTLQHQAPEA